MGGRGRAGGGWIVDGVRLVAGDVFVSALAVTRKRREEEEGDRWLFVSRSSMSVVAGAGKPIELDGQQSRGIQPDSISRHRWRIHRGCG